MRKGVLFMVALFMVLLVGGCNTYKSYVFAVDTGDDVEVKLDTTDGWRLENDFGRFIVKKGEKEIITGYFGSEENYNESYENITTSDLYTVMNEKSRDGYTYIHYSYEGKGNYVIMMLEGTNTCVYMLCEEDADTANEAYNRLTIKIK